MISLLLHCSLILSVNHSHVLSIRNSAFGAGTSFYIRKPRMHMHTSICTDVGIRKWFTISLQPFLNSLAYTVSWMNDNHSCNFTVALFLIHDLQNGRVFNGASVLTTTAKRGANRVAVSSSSHFCDDGCG